MKKLILTIALAVATISFCDAKAPIKGNGAEKNDARTIEPYSAISVADGIALNFSKDHLSGVVVTADENVLEHIVTEVVGGELLIHFNYHNCDVSTFFTRNLHMTDINLIFS